MSVCQAALPRVGITSPKGEQESRRPPCTGVHTMQAGVCRCCTRCGKSCRGSHCAGLGCRYDTRAYHTRGRRSVQVPSASNYCGCGTRCRPRAAGAPRNANRGLWVRHTLRPWRTEAPTHWIWHFSMQVHCKQSPSASSSTRVGWKTSIANHARVFTQCRPVFASVARVAVKCRRRAHDAGVGCGCQYTVQAEAAGITREADLACGCQCAGRCCGCCTRCRPSRGWHTRCRHTSHKLRVAYQAVGSTHRAAVGCGCHATRCRQGCGCYTQCRQWYAGETRVAAMAASVSWWQKLESIRSLGMRSRQGPKDQQL